MLYSTVTNYDVPALQIATPQFAEIIFYATSGRVLEVTLLINSYLTL